MSAGPMRDAADVGDAGDVRRTSPAPTPVAALQGVNGLDFSHVIAGPFATFYLAALGARVIKVENPHREDSMRAKPRAFTAFNHGKEVVQIDLTMEEGRAQAWALFEEADVFVDNMRPGVLAQWGFGEEALRAKKPALIHCAISGYGRSSQWAERSSYDHVIQAASGMTLLAGSDGDGPIKVGFPVIDGMSGVLAALAIVAAIRRRDLIGEGERIDVSMFAAAMQLMYPFAVETLATGKAPPRVGNVGYSGSPGAETFTCRDGLLALGANTPQQVQAVAQVLGIEAQVRPLVAGQTKGFLKPETGQQLRQLLIQAFSQQSAAEMETALSAAKVPAARVRDMAEAMETAKANGLIDRWALGSESPVQTPGLGFFADTLFAGRSHPYGSGADEA